MNEGVNPVSNETVIPKSAFEAITTASSIAFGTASDIFLEGSSLTGYGMGWFRASIQGREVRYTCGRRCSPAK